MTAPADRVRALVNALEKLPPYVGPVFRGSNLPVDVLDRYVPGTAVTEFAFVSTTADVTSDFPVPAEFEIFSRNGKDISQMSAHPEEKEVLFTVYTTFEVLSRAIDPTTGKTHIRLADTGWLGEVDRSRAIAGKVFTPTTQLGMSFDPVPAETLVAIERVLDSVGAARRQVPPLERVVRSDKFWDDLTGTRL